MSWHGLQVIAHIDDGYDEGLWWLGYASKLTPDERKAVKRGDHGVIVRPLEPTWREGDWVDAAPNLRIQIASVRFGRRDTYRVRIARVEDFRGGGVVTERRLREPRHNVSTLGPGADPNAPQPEPQRIPNSIVEKLPSTLAAKARYADQHAKDTERRLRRSVIEDIRQSELSVVELEQLRRAVEAIKAGRVAA